MVTSCIVNSSNLHCKQPEAASERESYILQGKARAAHYHEATRLPRFDDGLIIYTHAPPALRFSTKTAANFPRFLVWPSLTDA
jgi:hypothetical protein